MDGKINPGIGCSVTNCKHNCVEQQFCSLDKIYVSECAKSAKKSKDTLCGSFECRQ